MRPFFLALAFASFPADSGDAASDSGDSGVVPPSCSATVKYGAGTLLSISTAQSDLFGAVTPDELTIAWMTTAGSVLYADRAKASDPFGAPQTLTAGVALGRVALSPDGLALIVVLADRSALAQSTRSSRTAAFSTSLDKAPFASLDPLPTEIDAGTAPPHGSFGDPMLSPDGQFLYYSQYGVSKLTMCESYRKSGDTSPWGQGRNLLEQQLQAPDTSGTRMIPSGMSIDDLALFYWDGVAQTERIAIRDSALTNNTYKQFVTIGAAYQYAAPTASCSRIYFSSAGDGGPLDLFFANAN
jgi:hypothetical protein